MVVIIIVTIVIIVEIIITSQNFIFIELKNNFTIIIENQS